MELAVLHAHAPRRVCARVYVQSCTHVCCDMSCTHASTAYVQASFHSTILVPTPRSRPALTFSCFASSHPVQRKRGQQPTHRCISLQGPVYTNGTSPHTPLWDLLLLNEFLRFPHSFQVTHFNGCALFHRLNGTQAHLPVPPIDSHSDGFRLQTKLYLRCTFSLGGRGQMLTFGKEQD